MQLFPQLESSFNLSRSSLFGCRQAQACTYLYIHYTFDYIFVIIACIYVEHGELSFHFLFCVRFHFSFAVYNFAMIFRLQTGLECDSRYLGWNQELEGQMPLLMNLQVY